MKLDEDTLLREINSLYSSYGYRRYRSECFEDYALFSENRDFLLCKNVLTFSDRDGKLRALRPDVTISLIKRINLKKSCERLFYNEKVFRPGDEDGRFREISQAGVEVVGDIKPINTAETVYLACETLSRVSDSYILCLSHMGFLEGLFDWFSVEGEARTRLYELLKMKNLHDFSAVASSESLDADMAAAFSLLARGPATLTDLSGIIKNEKMKKAFGEMTELLSVTEKLGLGGRVRLDFSVVSDENYYDGVIFNGFVKGLPKAVLSGGRYDRLVKKLGKSCGAIGFALYLDRLERLFAKDSDEPEEIFGEDAAKALITARDAVAAGRKVRLGEER
ncbi:MAG: ATP phosphoribosyltransferase regulatory subunit [Clostridia bacterium]|nr:ATP phosphoribosyltransferase regulatory subunit [Clostridia bacterium]